MRTLSPKAYEAKARHNEQKRQWRENPILRVVDGDKTWTIFRLDEDNIVLTDDPDLAGDYRYFPSFDMACMRLLRELTHDSLKPPIQQILGAVHAAETMVLAALKNIRVESIFLDGEREDGDTRGTRR